MRTRNKYVIGQTDTFQLSRAKIDNFINCPRCFIVDRREGVSAPGGPPFTLNSAVDGLLKKEFDRHRVGQTVHPIVYELGYNFLPFQHEKIDEWRENFKGVRYLDPESNFLVTGAVDDIWVNPDTGSIHVIDYKATARKDIVEFVGDTGFHLSYKRQLEMYQWLLRRNDVQVSDTGYWLYATGRSTAEEFNKALRFDFRIISYEGSEDWISPLLITIKQALETSELPQPTADCEMCNFLIDYSSLN